MPHGPEDRLIAWLERHTRTSGRSLIGDDAAILEPSQTWAATVDHQIEGTHFPAGLAPTWIARRLVRVNLSDLAAMGARPELALLALAAPTGFAFKRFLRALTAELDNHGVRLAGGDLARAPRLSTSLTLLGSRHRGGHWVRRHGGRPGDRLWLGGTVGTSAAGRLVVARGARPHGSGIRLPARLVPRDLTAIARQAVRRHLLPEPQLELGRWLSRRRRAAAIDISDGLMLDLGRLLREPGTRGRGRSLGAIVESRTLPLDSGIERLAQHLKCNPIELALAGGEDYVLLFALPNSVSPPSDFGATAIGRIRSTPGIRIEGLAGKPPPSPGWDHLRS